MKTLIRNIDYLSERKSEDEDEDEEEEEERGEMDVVVVAVVGVVSSWRE